ncbi:ABC transporter permease [bacterium AH-315-J04]|nr:ABC transporter permease [bacterium AH-315-J04]
MMQVWTIARQMIAEGIRMKIALVFFVLIAAIVFGLPFSVTGDSSLTGAVQSFMSYSLMATGLLLGVLTIFMCRSLSDEFVHHQMFLVVTKPVARWQIILGKWLGICLFNATFLLFSGASMYGMVQYIKWTHPPQDKIYDEQELTNEVLVARHASESKVPDFLALAEAEFQHDLEQGKYEQQPNFDPRRQRSNLFNKYEARWRVIGPYETREFFFDNILCDRSAGNEIQIRYKADVSGYEKDEIFRAVWRMGDRAKGAEAYELHVRHVIGRFHTMRVPADAVAPDNTLKVTFVNINPFEGEIQKGNVLHVRKSDGLQVLFIVGSFEWNLIRLLSMMMCKLMFLGAVGLMMATVFSYPVACLTSFTVYTLAGTRSFLEEALEFMTDRNYSMFSSVSEFAMQSIAYMYDMVQWVIPSFSRYDAIEDFVNGRNVSLVWVLSALGELVVIKTVVILGLAIFFFYRREVAEISV